MAVAFQLGIDNTSPTITYFPFFPNTVALNATAGWTPYYTISGFPSTSGLVGDGTSLQISSKNGSFFSLTWFGTGIDLYGNATLAAFDVSLDRKTGTGTSGNALVDPGSNLLASFSDLQLDTYTVTLTAHISSSPSSFIAFDRAVITSAMEVMNLDNVTVHSDQIDDTSIAYKGRWSSQEYAPGRYVHTTSRLGDSAQLTFNGTAVSVFGLRDPAAGYYNVTLDGETTQYNASSVWSEGAVLFYRTGLDPQHTHSLTITNAVNSLLTVGYVNTTLVSGVPISTSGISKGAIAGIVVGIVLGVVVFPILGFALWRWRRRWRRWRNERDFTFIEPSIHKGLDIAEVLDIQPGGLDQRWKSPTQSPTSEVSLDLFPVTIPHIVDPQSKSSPPTFPRSPTTSSLSPTQRLRDSGGGGVVHSPEAADQSLSAYINLEIDSEPTPSPGIHRRSTIPKPSGPRLPSYRFSTDDPRIPAFMPPAQTIPDPTPTGGEEPPEPEMQQINERGRSTVYSFLDMNPSSGPSSTIDGVGQSRNPEQSVPQVVLDSPPHSLLTRSNSAQSHLDSDRRRESRTSKPLSLSVVIQQPPTLEYPQSTEPHPYSPYSRGNRLTPQFLRPRTGERASPTESIPFTTSEVSEIRFSHPGESGEPSASRPGSGLDPEPSPLRTTATTSQIYRKLFGTSQGEIPQDGLPGKKRPLHRKALSSSTFKTPPQT